MSDQERKELLRLRKENKRISKENQRTSTENQRLSELLNQLQLQLKESVEGNKELREQLKDLQEKLDVLLVQLKKRNRRDYGNKTERHNPRPAREQKTIAPKEASPDTNDSSRKGEKHILAQDLPSEIVKHSLTPEEGTCPDCIIETVFVANEITYQLERLTSSLKKLEHHQEVRACPRCKSYIRTAEKPCPPIPGSYAGPGLLASVIVSKFADGLPNYRQEKIFKRQKAVIPRSTQSGWVLASAATLEPLYALLVRHLMKSEIVRTDDTEIKIQDRSHKRKMRKGKMTAYLGDKSHALTAFDFSPDQSFKRNISLLKDFKGFVQADAANGFDALFADGTKTEVGCNAHSRRKYFECLVALVETKQCGAILDIYSRLYEIEGRIKGKSSEIRLSARQGESKPLMQQLHQILLPLQGKYNPEHSLTKAVNYTLKHWTALTRFLEFPDLNIDNNETEQAIKGFVLSRKNFLFAGSNDGGSAAAV
ncbi:MAG: IS66 family transposase, partial [Anaerolineae bacterium]|nr:IS66 family transposase [Anaerolineae bacterium]